MIFNTKLPLNKNDNSFDEQFNDINYQIMVRNIHDAGYKYNYFNYADVFMLGHICGVSQ